jgi:hypothetical protein
MEMYFWTNDRLGEPQVVCDPAEHSLERLSTSLTMFKKEADKSYPDANRLKRLGTLVGWDADNMSGSLADFIDRGCCEPELKALEAQVRALPWVFQKQRGKSGVVRVEIYRKIVGTHRNLINAIQQAQRVASSKCAAGSGAKP